MGRTLAIDVAVVSLNGAVVMVMTEEDGDDGGAATRWL